MKKVHISCPKCGWEPEESCRWVCDVCKTKWNTFETHGRCPGCDKVFVDTQCSKRWGGCGEWSLNEDWYQEIEVKSGFKSIFSWGKSNELPVTANDKRWVEQSLLLLADMFEPSYFKSLNTITPEKKYFDRIFTGIEEDAEFIFERLIYIMDIDAWEIELKYYSNSPTLFSDGTLATPSPELNKSWSSSTGKYVDNGLGHKEIWIELSMLEDAESLISTMSHQLAHYKLLGESRMEEKDELLADLIAIVFGLGIFLGNSYFKHSRWRENGYSGWQMRRTGYLPEQVIAYATAWLAHYRNEDIAWKHYMNKTIRKYFDQSYDYIQRNPNTIKRP